MDPAPISVRGITKRFGGREVLSDVSFELHPGEFVGLLGPNGSGKSTCIKILDGVYQPDAGSVAGLGRHDVGVIHQDLGLVDSLTVLENVRLGLPAVRAGGLVNRFAEARKARAALEAVGLDLPLGGLVGSLSPAEKALLAVARLMQRRPRLIILDEVTSTLTRGDSDRVVGMLRAHAPADVTTLMVSHKLSEILDLASRLLVIQDGRLVVDRRTPLPNLAELTRMLSPVDAEELAEESGEADLGAEPLIELDGARTSAVGPISFSVRPGEAVALSGRVGSRIEQIAMLAAGLEQPSEGTVRVAAGHSRAMVVPQRETQGNFGDLSVGWNETIAALGRWRRLGGFLGTRRERREALEAATAMNVQPLDVDLPQRALSGGNQQKVLFARAMLRQATVYVLCEPTRGVDIATRQRLYRTMRDLKRQGCALIVVASDPDDVLAVSDRILRVEAGRIVDEWPRTDVTVEHIAAVI